MRRINLFALRTRQCRLEPAHWSEVFRIRFQGGISQHDHTKLYCSGLVLLCGTYLYFLLKDISMYCMAVQPTIDILVSGSLPKSCCSGSKSTCIPIGIRTFSMQHCVKRGAHAKLFDYFTCKSCCFGSLRRNP